MIYLNDDNDAIMAMEKNRTGFYGEYDNFEIFSENKHCPVCGGESPEKFYINDNEECIGCKFCVYVSNTPY